MGKDKEKTKNKQQNGDKPLQAESKGGADPAKPAKAAPDAVKFNLDDPKLPKAIEDAAMRSGGYPYDKRLKREDFEAQLYALQIELTKLQLHNIKTGSRILALFEGRDGAGKGSCIKAFAEHLNPRTTRTIALTKPTETERGQLYFQRYAVHLPTAGETVLFDRSWYNRAGVERVMGFCTKEQLAIFLREAPEFEGLLVRDGILFYKFFLTIGREMQWQRFHERRHDPLKQWKVSEIDLAAIGKFDDYTAAAEDMLRFTHTKIAPWHVIRANDQRRARLEAIRAVLLSIDYEGRDLEKIGKPDTSIIGSGPEPFGPGPGA